MTPNSDERRQGNYNALEVMQEDYDNICGLLEELEATPDPEQAQVVFAQLYNEVVLHSTIAADVFYPNLRLRLEAPDFVARFQDRLGQGQELLDSAVYLDPASGEFKQAVARLRTLLETHFQQEQDELFPRVREKMNEDELEELAVVLEQSKGQVQHSHTSREDGGATVRAVQPTS